MADVTLKRLLWDRRESAQTSKNKLWRNVSLHHVLDFLRQRLLGSVLGFDLPSFTKQSILQLHLRQMNRCKWESFVFSGVTLVQHGKQIKRRSFQLPVNRAGFT